MNEQMNEWNSSNLAFAVLTFIATLDRFDVYIATSYHILDFQMQLFARAQAMHNQFGLSRMTRVQMCVDIRSVDRTVETPWTLVDTGRMIRFNVLHEQITCVGPFVAVTAFQPTQMVEGLVGMFDLLLLQCHIVFVALQMLLHGSCITGGKETIDCHAFEQSK